MPPLNEGTILYMPTTLPGISVTEASRLLQVQDRILKAFPEVVSVHGKAGRAETSTDPAPFSMMETVVQLKPDSEWRPKERWYSGWAPEWLKDAVLRRIWSDRITWDELVAEMDQALRIPGQTNAWTMPIKARIDMLTTGVRTPVGIKIYGSDLAEIERLGSRGRGGAAGRARHAQRLRRAGRGRVLRGPRPAARRDRAVRPQRRRRAGRRHVRDRRGERHHHRSRAARASR